MKNINNFSTTHPILFVISSTILWLVVLLVLTAIISGISGRPYGDEVSSTISRLITTVIILMIIFNLGWLDAIGITKIGKWRIWLIAFGGIIYFACASLYSFFGEVSFNFSHLIQSRSAQTAVIVQFVVSLCEEIMFRGLVLYSLVRVWGNTRKGIFVSVVLTSFLFSIPHIMQVFTAGVSFLSVLILVLEGSIVAFWWGALVLYGKSIWPAIFIHMAGNAIVSVQGLLIPMVEPEILAYTRLLLFSLPLCALGIILLIKITPLAVVPDVP